MPSNSRRSVVVGVVEAAASMVMRRERERTFERDKNLLRLSVELVNKDAITIVDDSIKQQTANVAGQLQAKHKSCKTCKATAPAEEALSADHLSTAKACSALYRWGHRKAVNDVRHEPARIKEYGMALAYDTQRSCPPLANSNFRQLPNREMLFVVVQLKESSNPLLKRWKTKESMTFAISLSAELAAVGDTTTFAADETGLYLTREMAAPYFHVSFRTS